MLTLIGAGAVGTTLAAHLAAAGKPLRLYARAQDRDRFAACTQLRLDRPHRPPLQAPRPPLTTQLWDDDTQIVLLATKFGALETLLPALQALPRHITVVSTLNGVQALPLIRRHLPQHVVAALTVMFNAQHCGPLHAQLTTRAAVILAGGDASLKAAFAGTGLALTTAQGEQACWGKLLINLANAIGALTHSTFRDLLSQPDLRAVMVAVMDEAVDRLDSAGITYRLPMPLPYRAYRALLQHGGPLPWWLARLKNGLDDGAYPSMVADLRDGRVTEVGQLNGEIVALGERLQWPAPVNAALMQLVRQHERQVYQPLTPAQLRQAVLLPARSADRR